MKTSAGSLLLLSLAAAVSGSLEEAVFSPQDTLYAAVEFYNRGSEQLNAFKEESALHEPRRREDDSSVYYKLKFTMRETVCPNTENFNKLYCSFMEGGMQLKCNSLVSVLKENLSKVKNIKVTCAPIPTKLEEGVQDGNQYLPGQRSGSGSSIGQHNYGSQKH